MSDPETDRRSMQHRRSWFLLLGPVLGVVVGFASSAAGLPPDASWTAGVTALCATWWLTEAIPIPATSLIPFAAFPLLGILDHGDVAHAYGHSLILLLLGGFVLSKAVESSGTHRRLALGMVHLFGRLGRRGLVLGFMVATALSSMWISNSATVLMLLPVALAILDQDDSEGRALEAPLLLGIAWAASIGGLGTPIGTPPNATFMGIYEQTTGKSVAFAEWMAWGIPVVLLLVPIAWYLLTRKVPHGPVGRIPHPGPWRPAERRVLVIFTLTALAWITRAAPFLGGGWSAWLGIDTVGDETIALTAVVALFLIPDGTGGRLLTWEAAESIPWGLLLLFAGGIAIAQAFQASGLSDAIGEGLRSVTDLPAVVLVALLALVVTFLTEITSNTATTVLLMPILAAAALQAGRDPKLLMVPAAMSASCAFMLPVATAPNAIMFGTGKVSIAQMARRGFWLNLAGAVVITAVCAVALG